MPNTAETYGRLPWRGPEIPVRYGSPEEKLPQDRLFVKVEQLDMGKAEDRILYADVLNRHENGYAKILDQRISETGSGFVLLLVWGELYQCGPEFIPEEGRPIIRSNSLPNLVSIDDTESPCVKPEFGKDTEPPVSVETDVEAPAVTEVSGLSIKLSARTDRQIEGE